ncbi:MAG TPA: DUF1549 and DUF1553 domain-containing protein [Gemmataceae bacterium]
MPAGPLTRCLGPALAALLGCGAAAPAGAAAVLPGGGKLETVDFERHVMGLFGKAGCNSGSCHGSFQGKNGFRLSLFGYDPDKDFAAVTRDNLGRRIDRVDPDRSLLLLKATGKVPHEGGARFGADSWQYQVFREWIRRGAPREPGSGAIAELTVTPAGYVFCPQDEEVQLTVTARFADGSEEDVTPFCDFRVQDDAVAHVTPLGLVTGIRPGDSGLVVSYRGEVRAVRVLVPMPAKPGFKYPDVPAFNYIDREVLAKLRLLNMVPSELSGDAEFLRRVTIDTIGRLPEPEEVRAFLADTRPDKRAKKIEELLAHPLHAALWATKFSDITGNDTEALENPQQYRAARSQMWHDWFRKRVQENMPYDQIVKGVLTATSREGRSPEEWIEHVNKIDAEMEKDGFATSYAERETLDLFWRRLRRQPVEIWGERVAAAFLGVRLECAQCHKHPTDRWTQADYRGFANIFAQVSQGVSPETRKLVTAENKAREEKFTGRNRGQMLRVQEMFLLDRPRGALPHPDTNRPLPPKALGGPELGVKRGADVREALFEWMADPDNPFFARSFVNRVWGHYFGVGLVDPVDDFSLANPPSNARLLDALAKDFAESGYDIRHLERTILNSRTYQLSSVPNETNGPDRINFARSYVRPLMAEVVVDVINSALQTRENYGRGIPAGKSMIEVGSTRVQGNVAYVLRIFGRPPRTAACDCERAMDPALPQTLYRMSDNALLQKLRSSGRVAQVLRSKMTDEEAFEELVLATLSRPPTAAEREAFAEHKARTDDRRELLEDTLWALLNTREFILNH